MVNIFFALVKFISKGKINLENFYEQSGILVFNSLIPVITIGIALGVVLGVQMGPEFVSHGLGNQLGIVSALTMTRELIPVVGSLMIATQFGTGITAEIANMKITEQIDALQVFKVDHVRYLVVPRFLAAVVFSPIIIWISSVIAVYSTYLTVNITDGIRLQGFANSIWDYLRLKDIGLCLFKSSVFGGLIVLIAVTLSLEVTGGAKEVGKATTQTVILSFIFIVIIDYIISSLYL
jgi:phospholipid/cholesterol/gamma-HCH transport system permease protein